MSDIDLIPQAYRNRRRRSRWLKAGAVLVGTTVTLLVAAVAALHIATASAKSRVARLQAQLATTTEQHKEVDRLGARKAELEQQYQLLSGLRSGAVAEDMFVTIDRALADDDVWFLDWRFRRAGVMVEEQARTVNTGYFIVVPAGVDTLPDEGMRVQTHMTILGRARDHAALSRFVRRLFVQPEIHDVRIRKTAVIGGTPSSGHVEFDLAIILNTDVRRD